jgi:hypothetical protein
MVGPEQSGTEFALTTAQLVHDLREIDHLIAALRRTQSGDYDDRDDLSWLQTRRRYVLAVLAWRNAQKSKKIVSLALWRSGGVAASDTRAQTA